MVKIAGVPIANTLDWREELLSLYKTDQHIPCQKGPPERLLFQRQL